MSEFIQQRHKTFHPLEQPRELVVACAPLRSNVNLSRIARTAGSCGVRRLICCGQGRLIDKIARNSAADDLEGDITGLEVEVHRTLPHVLRELRRDGFTLVGLEQTTQSIPIADYAFVRRSVLVVGNERAGLDEESLRLVDQVVEIPVYGPPFAFNVATATAMALYEFCRQFPQG